MKKKTIITVLAAFIVGGLIGGGAGVLYTTRLTANTLLLLKTGELQKSAQQASQAYFDETETPAVATWALNSHLGVVHALREIDYPHDAELRLHELASHVRLGELAGRRGDAEAQASHMAKALSIAQDSPEQAFRDMDTEVKILAFMTKMNKARLP